MDRRLLDYLHLSLTVLPESYAICRLDSDEEVPGWARTVEGGFSSVTRTAEELSAVCPQTQVPPGVTANRDWRCLKIEGPLPFDAVGILSSVLIPLSEASVSIFSISTYDTDYLLVKERDLERAIYALTQAGHMIGRA